MKRAIDSNCSTREKEDRRRDNKSNRICSSSVINRHVTRREALTMPPRTRHTLKEVEAIISITIHKAVGKVIEVTEVIEGAEVSISEIKVQLRSKPITVV